MKKNVHVHKNLARLGIIAISTRTCPCPMVKQKIQEVLSRHAAVIKRQDHYSDDLQSIIVILVRITVDELGAVTGKLGMIDEVQVKSLLV